MPGKFPLNKKLLNAAQKGDIKELQKLLEAKVNPNSFPKREDGPLHLAAKNGHEEAVKLLLSYKARVNCKGKWGVTPLMYASRDAVSLPIVKMLIDAGANISIKNESKQEVLCHLLGPYKMSVDIIRLLIESGADFKNYKADYGPMHFAASYAPKEIVALLIEKGASIKTKNREGKTPMDAAIEHKNHEVVKLLLAEGADPDSRDRSGFGKTLLQYAADSGDKELVKEILRRQAEKKAKTKKDISKNISLTGALVQATKKDDLSMVKVLVDCGLDINDRDDYDNETALMRAACFGKIEILNFLLENGADIKARNKHGHTALLHAAAGGQSEAVEMLLKSGADVNEKNNLNWNALMQASFRGNLSTAEILLKAGSSVNEIDQEKGASVLWLARHSGNSKLVELLESYGAQERSMRKRQSGEPYFPITDCDICAYLPHKTELTHDYGPEEIPGLEIIYKNVDVDYKAVDTEMIKKCTTCGTYYRHYHYIDEEDSIGGAGPVCSHYMIRYNLLWIHGLLRELDKKEELTEAEARYPVIIDSFLQLCNSRQKLMPYIKPYVIESLTDFFIMRNDWNSIWTKLLEHEDPFFALTVADGLISVYGQTDQLESRFQPLNSKSFFFKEYRRNFIPEIRKKLRPLITKHKTEFRKSIKKFQNSEDPEIQKIIENILQEAKSNKLFKRR